MTPQYEGDWRCYSLLKSRHDYTIPTYIYTNYRYIQNHAILNKNYKRLFARNISSANSTDLYMNDVKMTIFYSVFIESFYYGVVYVLLRHNVTQYVCLFYHLHNYRIVHLHQYLHIFVSLICFILLFCIYISFIISLL